MNSPDNTTKQENKSSLSSAVRDIFFLLAGILLTGISSFISNLTFLSESNGSVQEIMTFVSVTIGVAIIILVVLILLVLTYYFYKGEIDAASRRFVTHYLKNSATELNENVGALRQNITCMNKHVSELNSKVLELDGKVQRLDHDVVQRFTGNPDDIQGREGILKEMRSLMDRLSLAHEETYFYQDDPDDTEHHFIHDEQALDSGYQDLRILGTMMGVSADGYNVCEHIKKLTEARFAKNKDGAPFSVCRLAVPAGPDVSKSLFALCARRFALQLTETIRKVYENQKAGLPNIEVRISYLTPMADIFPAIQIWDKRKCLIVPSVGNIDRVGGGSKYTSVARALPVALGVRQKIRRIGKDENYNGDEEREYNLDLTLKRIVDLFDEGYFNNNKLTYRFLSQDIDPRAERYQIIPQQGYIYSSSSVKCEVGNEKFDTSRLTNIRSESDAQSIINDLGSIISL